MDRRGFLRRASAMGITAAVAARTTQQAASGPCLAGGDTTVPNQAGAERFATESGVMEGAPPSPEKLVTRENYSESQAKMRWAMQHWRELFPTQRVRRSDNPMILPRCLQDIRAMIFDDTTGQKTTVERQLKKLDVNAIIVLTGGTITFEGHVITALHAARLGGSIEAKARI